MVFSNIITQNIGIFKLLDTNYWYIQTFIDIYFFNGTIIAVIKMITNNLQFCREEIGITQDKLGSVLNVHKSTISGWENGHSIIPFKKLLKFCQLYNYSLDFVCGLTRKNIEYPKIDFDNKTIGSRLKELRKKLGLTQQEIAKECSISQTTYSTYESGIYLISTITIYTICTKYNISIDWIVGLKNDDYKLKMS